MVLQQSSQQFRQFLLTGCERGVYRAHSPEGMGQDLRVRQYISSHGSSALDDLLNFPASRQQASLHALALAAAPRFASRETNDAALAALPLVARTAADLVSFCSLASKVRGWGRGMRTAVANWYLSQPVRALASQILRRPEQNLKQHRTILRRAHPKAAALDQNALFQWIADGRLGHLATPEVRAEALHAVEGWERIRAAANAREAVRWIEEYRPSPAQVDARWRTQPAVWEALFHRLTYRQLLRYLPAMSACGLLARGSAYTALTVARLASKRPLSTGSIHPLRVLEAMKRYRQPQARPVEAVFDALEEAFHLAAQCADPAAFPKTLVAIDATGSMQGAPVNGMPHTTAALAAAAIAMAIPNARMCAFHNTVRDLDFRFGRTRLADLLNQVRATPSRSEVAAPLDYARENRLKVDAFVILTDRTTQPEACMEALHKYHEALGHPAKLILVALSATDIPTWQYPDHLAFAGMDHGGPAAIKQFLRPPESDTAVLF